MTTTVGFGASWLAPRLHEFFEMYPDVSVSLLLDDLDLDLAMREADVAIRMHPPKQPDLVQRHLLTIDWLVVASPDYLKRHGVPQRAEEISTRTGWCCSASTIRFGVADINWLAEAGRRPGNPRRAALEVNSTQAVLLAVRSGLGIGVLPDFMASETQDLVRVLPELKGPKVEVFFVYPEELRNSKRVAVFRDFLLTRLAELH